MIGVVGGGLAAAKLVEGYREAGGQDEITVWSQDPRGPYHRPGLSKRVLRGEADPESVLIDVQGAEIRYERLGALPDTGVVVLATGARPRELGDALQLRTLDDSIELRRRAETAREAVVVGGGFIGCEVAASLTQLGVRVTQIVREPTVFASLHCAPLSDALHDAFRAHGVDLRLEESEIPEAELTVAGVGVQPNVELAADAGIEVRNGIVVDERFRTSRDGVYAIGDVAEFYDPVYRRHRRVEHWSNSAYHGTTLGKILAGEDVYYNIVSAFFSEQFGQSFKAFGDGLGHDDSSLEGAFQGDRAVFRYLKGGNTIAAVLKGLEEDEENALKEEIRSGAAAAA